MSSGDCGIASNDVSASGIQGTIPNSILLFMRANPTRKTEVPYRQAADHQTTYDLGSFHRIAVHLEGPSTAV
jgi:hypothetical protein